LCATLDIYRKKIGMKSRCVWNVIYIWKENDETLASFNKKKHPAKW
jgi:hypothetical protein